MADTTHWTTIGAFWATFAVAIITVMATIINYLLYRSQTDPEVIVYVTTDPKRPSIILLVIENIGKGLARNINFSFSKPIPKRAFGLGAEAPMPAEMDRGPLISGIPALAPRATRVINWGQLGGLTKWMNDDVIDITITYDSNRNDAFSPQSHQTVCPIDVKSLIGINASETLENEAVKELKRIGDALAELVLNNKSTAPLED